MPFACRCRPGKNCIRNMGTENTSSYLAFLNARSHIKKRGIHKGIPGAPSGHLLYLQRKSEAQVLVKKLQDFITDKMYACTNDILRSLGKMYASGGDFTRNIDRAGGEGTAQFASDAIDIYCR